MKYRVFVYGSLKKNGWNHSLLEQSNFLGKAYIRGYSLYHVASYPGMIKSENRLEQVYGELYEIDEPTLKRLDSLESEGYLYKRELVSVRCNHENIDAYTYIYLLDTWNTTKVKGNDWKGGLGRANKWFL